MINGKWDVPVSRATLDGDLWFSRQFAAENQYLNKYETFTNICRPSLMNVFRVLNSPSGDCPGVQVNPAHVRCKDGSRFCKLLL